MTIARKLLPLLFFCVALCAQSPSKWIGHWEYQNQWLNGSGDFYDVEQYALDVTASGNGLEATLTADGRMLHIRANLRPILSKDDLKFYFIKSIEPGMPNFQENDLLFELVRKKNKIKTIWNKLIPSNARNAGIYFKKMK